MPRAQNSHAIVNAGFLLEFNDNPSKSVILSARICYGGINPYTLHAINTENFLLGRNLYTNETLQGALKMIYEEINPDWILPDYSPDYRKSLALSLFYRFVLRTAPKEIVDSRYLSGGQMLIRGLSSGTHSFDGSLSKNIRKLEADVQCTGEAEYINDIPIMHDELHCAFVLATRVHRKIVEFDTSIALVR